MSFLVRAHTFEMCVPLRLDLSAFISLPPSLLTTQGRNFSEQVLE